MLLGIELDKLPKGKSFLCSRCDAEFTIHTDLPFNMTAVDQKDFRQGFICHCGQYFQIEKEADWQKIDVRLTTKRGK